MFETGMLKLLGTQLPAGALERLVPTTGWTVRHSLGHLATAQTAYADALEAFASASPPGTAPSDATNMADTRAVELESRPLPAILADFDASLRRLVAQLNLVSADELDLAVGNLTLRHFSHVSSNHAASHAIQMLQALPELRGDPMLLNWLLYQDFSRDPADNALQQQLLAEVRERYATEDSETAEETDE